MRSTPGSIPGGFSGGLPRGTAVANSWPPPSAEPEPGPYGGPPAGEPGPYGGPPAGEPAGPYGGGGSRRVGPYGGDGPQQGGPYGGNGPQQGGPYGGDGPQQGGPPGGQYPGGPPHPGGQYPGGPYAGSPYAAPQGRGNGFAVASLVCGVVGLILALVVVGALPGLLAIALGIVGLVRARRGFPHKGLAIAGITLGVISLVIAIVISVLIGRFLGDRLTAYRDCLRLAQTTDQRRACEDQLRRGLENDTQGITAGNTTPAAEPAGSVTLLPAVVIRQWSPAPAATR